MNENIILKANDDLNVFKRYGGGKALNMARMTQFQLRVPEWFCLSSDVFAEYVKPIQSYLKFKADDTFAEQSQRVENIFIETPLSPTVLEKIERELKNHGLENQWLAVRSSGLDEDSANHSFAGQFSSFLFVKGLPEISLAIRRCWASAYSERGLVYRKTAGLKTDNIQMGVVIQRMVPSEISGVAFTRNPINVADQDHMVFSSVYGLGEGLVSGELDADNYLVPRAAGKVEKQVVTKTQKIIAKALGGIEKVDLEKDLQEKSSLSDELLAELKLLCLKTESFYQSPQDIEWAYDGRTLYLVQARPITNLPPQQIFNAKINGDVPILWDNSNIIESYSGVTSPLTFSFASYTYRQVYIQFCEVVGVPKKVIEEHESMYRNMLGILRGQIYYNLINWYRLVLMLPGSSSNKEFMETMMGVKQNLKPEYNNLFEFTKNPPRYGFSAKIVLLAKTIQNFLKIDSIVTTFMTQFNNHYQAVRKTKFSEVPLTELSQIYQDLEKKILKRWQAPIINDYLCMLFFGLLKKLTAKWVGTTGDKASLQNDLLCGQGNIESTEPTKMLMRIADEMDNKLPSEKQWLLSTDPELVTKQIFAEKSNTVFAERIKLFIDKYGFRCINELKLEELDLHDDPSFVVHAVIGYIKTKSYNLGEMEERELAIKNKAEAEIRKNLGPIKKVIYFWVLKHARKAVKNRENLRFARTKIFGVVRHIFRGMGTQLVKLDQLEAASDIFYLTVDEILSYIEGRAVSGNIKAIVQVRKAEYEGFKSTNLPPERIMTIGAVGVALPYPQLLQAWDILSKDLPKSDDPNLLYGTPCCPGIVEGEVRVVKTFEDAKGLEGQILVTERTDPGWVPLYPSCSGLLIERGSLLSHSAVVARELGLPTIVGVNGGLVKKLKTGMRVRVDASKGEIRIL